MQENYLFDIFITYNFIFSRFDEVVQWMNSVDAALQNIAFEVSDPRQFEQEKAKFVVRIFISNITEPNGFTTR